MANKKLVNSNSVFENTMRACLESKKSIKNRPLAEKKVVKKSKRLKEDEDIDIEDDQQEVMDDVVDDIVVVVDPEVSAEEFGEFAEELQDIVDDTPEDEQPVLDDYVGDYSYACPICGNTFFSDEEMHEGDECPVCNDVPTDFVLVGKVEDADTEDADDLEVDVDAEDGVEEIDIEDEELEEKFRKQNRKKVERRSKPSNYIFSINESSFHPFMDKFIKENYKNTKSFRMISAKRNTTSGAITVECAIIYKFGKKQRARLRLEGVDLKVGRSKVVARDISNTFKSESRKTAPFTFTIRTDSNKVITCEGMKYNFVTRLKEGKRARISGNLIRESRARK